jgi:hypothetical protein
LAGRTGAVSLVVLLAALALEDVELDDVLLLAAGLDVESSLPPPQATANRAATINRMAETRRIICELLRVPQT